MSFFTLQFYLIIFLSKKNIIFDPALSNVQMYVLEMQAN